MNKFKDTYPKSYEFFERQIAQKLSHRDSNAKHDQRIKTESSLIIMRRRLFSSYIMFVENKMEENIWQIAEYILTSKTKIAKYKNNREISIQFQGGLEFTIPLFYEWNIPKKNTYGLKFHELQFIDSVARNHIRIMEIMENRKLLNENRKKIVDLI